MIELTGSGLEVIELTGSGLEVIELTGSGLTGSGLEVIELTGESARIEADWTELGYFEALSRPHVRESRCPGMITPRELPPLYGHLWETLPTRFPLPDIKKPRRLDAGVEVIEVIEVELGVSSITLPIGASSASGSPVDLPAVTREEQAGSGCVGTRPAVAGLDRVDDNSGSAISAAGRPQVCRLDHYSSPQPAARRSSRVARATSPRSCFSAATRSRSGSSTQRNRSGSPR